MRDTEEAIKKTRNHTYRIVAREEHPRRSWGKTPISLFLGDGIRKKKIGHYVRNYPGFGIPTWFPFSRGSRDYALYSPDYTCTRVMELPSCKDIGGETPSSAGFCPVELYVPEIERWRRVLDKKDPNTYSYQVERDECPFAFVAGCVWADDSSWKVQCIDLSQVERGIIKRDDRFGYLELAEGTTLEKTIEAYEDEDTGILRVALGVKQYFNLLTGHRIEHDRLA